MGTARSALPSTAQGSTISRRTGSSSDGSITTREAPWITTLDPLSPSGVVAFDLEGQDGAGRRGMKLRVVDSAERDVAVEDDKVDR